LVTGLIVLAFTLVLAGAVIGLVLLVGDTRSFTLGESIAVVELDGIIADSGPILDSLVEFRRSDKIKAIILRIDSPGGGVAATQEIYQEIERTKKSKKIIASLGSLAASGGLYVAAPADVIVANPATVTGSIGVIMEMMNIQELFGKIGLNPVVIKSGQYKDIGSAVRPMTDEERALLQGVVDQLHHQFVRDLAKGRGLTEEVVSGFADGRIFTGEQALEMKLVDKLGNFEDAVALATKMAGITGRANLVYPRKKQSWWAGLLEGKSPLSLWPRLAGQPFSFQYLYLPGI
jgi:protease-4